MAINVNAGDDFELKLLALDHALEVEVKKLLLRRMESEGREVELLLLPCSLSTPVYGICECLYCQGVGKRHDRIIAQINRLVNNEIDDSDQDQSFQFH